jgi:hypothetical protein
MMTLTDPARTRPVSDEDLVHAIELRCSPVLGALNVANTLGGLETNPWRLVHKFSLVQLIDEAVARDIDLGAVKAACCDVLVVDTPPFRAAIGYDPRPRCHLCNRWHFVRVDRGETERSCGSSARVPIIRSLGWTRATAEAAVDGTYRP